jgi:hypothetical protein
VRQMRAHLAGFPELAAFNRALHARSQLDQPLFDPPALGALLTVLFLLSAFGPWAYFDSVASLGLALLSLVGTSVGIAALVYAHQRGLRAGRVLKVGLVLNAIVLGLWASFVGLLYAVCSQGCG